MANNSSYFSQPGNLHNQGQPRGAFKELEVAELYCPNCKQAVQVNKYLLLILPDGDKYEYRCRLCGTSVGKKTDISGQFHDILKSRRP